jgi:hypothetical protein
MTKFCCETFPKNASSFSWMTYKNTTNESILCMPYIQDGLVKYRVNYCPYCGKEVRDIEINLTEYQQF